jgi:hypothetical protein
VISQLRQFHSASLDRRDANRQPPTDRPSPQPAQRAAYRRLVLAILGLDVTSLADELHAKRCLAHALPNAA